MGRQACILVTQTLAPSQLRERQGTFMHGGQRKIDRWTALHRCVEVVFNGAQAVFNANTVPELLKLQAPGR